MVMYPAVALSAWAEGWEVCYQLATLTVKESRGIINATLESIGDAVIPVGIWKGLWMIGRRRSKSASRTALSARCARVSARFTAEKVLPSAGEGLVTPDSSPIAGCRPIQRSQNIFGANHVAWVRVRRLCLGARLSQLGSVGFQSGCHRRLGGIGRIDRRAGRWPYRRTGLPAARVPLPQALTAVNLP